MNISANLDIDLIQKHNIFSNSQITTGSISSLFEDREVLSTNFSYTSIINNQSHIFIKDTIFETNLSSYQKNQNVVNILNVNQSKLFGNNITIKNGYRYNDFFFNENTNLSTKIDDINISTYNWNKTLTSIPPSTSALIDGKEVEVTTSASIQYTPFNNIVTINTNNSQTTIQSDQLSSLDLQNGRNEDQSFFNFPSPNDINDYHIIPMLISNGERTIWSEGKYGYILEDKIQTIEDFLAFVPHDLNGQTFSFIITPEGINKIHNLSSYYNGTLNIVRRGSTIINFEETNIISFDDLTIQNCSIKITLSGFNFKKLTIKNSYKVYLNQCSFLKNNQLITLPEVTTEYNIYEWKKGNTNWVSNICLDISNSKVFIQNNKTYLKFNNFFIGLKANSSEIFINSTFEGNKIFLSQNLTNYSNTGNRPVWLLAYNGSRIYCNYKHIYADIIYPEDEFYGYKPLNTQHTLFKINNDVKNVTKLNYCRVKSLLFALYEEINNAKIFINAIIENNKNKINDDADFDNMDETAGFHSIPSYGLFQVAKPITGAQDGWVANKNIFIISGFQSSIPDKKQGDIEDQDNLRIVRNDNGQRVGNGAFAIYGVGNNGDFNYSSSQPHLAHYFSVPEKTSGVIEMAIQNFETEADALVQKTYKKEK